MSLLTSPAQQTKQTDVCYFVFPLNFVCYSCRGCIAIVVVVVENSERLTVFYCVHIFQLKRKQYDFSLFIQLSHVIWRLCVLEQCVFVRIVQSVYIVHDGFCMYLPQLRCTKLEHVS